MEDHDEWMHNYDYNRKKKKPKLRSSHNSNKPKWRTRDGTTILIEDMEDSHLHNTILFVESNMHSKTKSHWLNELNKVLIDLEEEREKRGLPIPLISIKSLEYRRKENVSL